MGNPARPLADRFHEKTEPDLNTGCVLWSGSTNHKGYGLIMVTKGYNRSTHRVAWELANGMPIPDGRHVLHKCDTPACVNPDHLWLGSNLDNTRDRMAKGRMAVGANRPKPSNTKLTLEKAEEIRTLARQGWSQKRLAAKYGVAYSLIFRIIKGLSWPQPIKGAVTC
jgi:hypothetical protein